MPKRYPDLLIEDMLDCIDAIDQFVRQTSDVKALEQNRLVRDAVVRNLEVLGEAANQLPEEVYRQFSRIPWRKIVGLRNRLIHDYTDVNVLLMWRIIREELPLLRVTLQDVLSYCREHYPWP
jgi:uncharacterized protein with HEPN domain